MIRLEPLTGHQDRNAFDCGVTVLNHWLRRTALQHQSKGISRTFVAVPLGDEVFTTWSGSGYQDIHPASILGFYALASAFVVVETLPPALARHYPFQIPVTRLGRLATRADLQGQGLRRVLLADAVNRARGAAQAVGSAGIVVDAKDDRAAGFYRQFCFHPCKDAPLQLFADLEKAPQKTIAPFIYRYGSLGLGRHLSSSRMTLATRACWASVMVSPLGRKTPVALTA